MARLYRPHIPLSVRYAVAARQLNWPVNDDLSRLAGYGEMLKLLLPELADKLGCEVSDLRLDHDPALGTRPKRGEGKRTVYEPAANDPEHLKYRPHGAQFDDSHDIKTRVRGPHGQFSDIALIKRERRRERKAADAKDPKKKRPKWRSAQKGKYRWPKRGFGRKASD